MHRSPSQPLYHRLPGATRRGVAGLVLSAVLLLAACTAGEPIRATAPASTAFTSDEAFLDTLQARTFRWFWDWTDPATGLVPDRAPSLTFSSVAAVGFGLTAYGVGAERGYVTREEARDRTLATLRFFWEAPQGAQPEGTTGYRGFFYHFLDLETGRRFRTVELSSIDTALLMMGVLFAREYFDGPAPEEAEIRALADSLYRRVEWDWMQPRAPLIGMGWHPESGFIPHDYRGLDEAMFLYVLALGSPTHPADGAAWDAYTSTYTWGRFQGQEYIQFAPLFGYHYPYVWIDPRGLQDAYLRDRGIDYFENARRATLAQHAYAIDNPGGFRDYGERIWGLTASDGPFDATHVVDGDTLRFFSYRARGVSLEEVVDDGTIAPTAAGGSIAYAPEIVIPTLRTMQARYGEHLFTRHGFVDAFNPTFRFENARIERGHVDPELGWFDVDHLGIDQGPILLMAENYRSGFVWEVMKRSPYVARGLCRAGFTAGWLEGRCE